MPAPERLGLFGGSFNPVHFGHLIAARAAAEALRLDRVTLIPSAAPPHKPDARLAPAEDRLAMTRLAVAGDPLFDVSDLELRRRGPSYTYDTVVQFRRDRPGATLYWIIGADWLADLASWYRIDELVNEVDFAVVVRPGQTLASLDVLEARVGRAAVARILAGRLQTPAVEISASDIRARVAAGRSIRYLTPDAVVQYIQEKSLYRNG